MARKLLLLIVLVLACSVSAEAQLKQPQPMGVRLMDINDSGELKTLFNAEKGKVRLVAILSPT